MSSTEVVVSDKLKPLFLVGWAPSEFRSSRTDRAKKKDARPEDFMDEEDLLELRENQKLVDTTEEMDLDFWERKQSAEGKE